MGFWKPKLLLCYSTCADRIFGQSDVQYSAHTFLPFTHHMQALEDFVRFRIRHIYPLLKRCYVAGSVPGWRTFWVVTQPWYFMSYFIVCVFGYRCFPSQTSTRTENIFTVICLSLDGFIWNQHNGLARLVVHYVGVVEVMGSNPAQASIFFPSPIFTTAVNSLNPKSD